MEWTIKQAANETGITPDTLRYYDKEGIVSPKRLENGYRYYDEEEIRILKNIVVMKYAHFSLAEIKNWDEIFYREPSMECNEISKRMLKDKIADLNRTICHYQKIVQLMETLLPMVESAETFHNQELKINDFINQIFEDIHGYRKNTLSHKK